jgi:asparagine synthase (glutamine-hydrolysing)
MGATTVQSGLAGAIGRDAAKLVFASRGNAKPSMFTEEGLVFAGEEVELISRGNEIFAVIGRPRFSYNGGNVGGGGAASIESWFGAFVDKPEELDSHVSGHYALSYVDFSARRVLLATDRFGSFSIYYRRVGSGIAFADRADVLFDEPPQLTAQDLFNYLYFHCVPGPRSVHEEVHRVEPGSLLVWEDGSLSEQFYWNRRAKEPLYDNFGKARTDFHRCLRQSVEEECSNETTGAFLSGGTDSSTVVGLLAERSEHRVRSYSIGFDVPGYDEAGYARLAADHFGTEHRDYYVTPDDLVKRLPDIAVRLDQPFGNSSLLPALICAERAAEDGITKLLAGDGGDELFGGNTRYAKQRIFGWYQTIPGPVRRVVLDPVSCSTSAERLPVLRKVKNYINQARIPLPDRLETYNLLEREGVVDIFTNSFLESVDVQHPRLLQRQVWEELSAEHLIDRMLEFDWKFTLADNDLRKVRYAASIAGVDVGFPLLSNELADFSLRLKPDWKVRGTNLRWFFKKALADFLPPEIIRKKKHGFGLPFGRWVCEHRALREIAVPSVTGLVDRGLVKEQYVKLLLEDRLPKYPNFYGEMVWILMMLELWLQAHSPDWKLPQ